jgi:hypothetical protein
MFAEIKFSLKILFLPFNLEGFFESRENVFLDKYFSISSFVQVLTSFNFLSNFFLWCINEYEIIALASHSEVPITLKPFLILVIALC